MEVTLLGITTLARLVQLSKAPTPMEVTLLGIVTPARLVQPLKVSASMEVTLSGIVTFAKLVQPIKTPSSMEVTLSGIVILPVSPYLGYLHPQHLTHLSGRYFQVLYSLKKLHSQ